MAQEILFSVILILMSAYGIVHVNSTIKSTVYTDPLGSAFWPTLLLSLLIVLMLANIIQIYKKTPAEKRNMETLKLDFPAILGSRLTWGVILMTLYALLLPVMGFLLSSFVMCVGMNRLLGERRWMVSISFSALVVAVVFIIFYRGMGIMLPRGTVPFLRAFGLAVEAFLRNLG